MNSMKKVCLARNSRIISSIKTLVSFQSTALHPSSVAPVQITDVEPKWQLMAAACITRTPIVCPPMQPVEKKLKDMMDELEVESSLKSDHELSIEEDKVRLALFNSGETDKVSIEEASKQTGLEFEDSAREELNAFEFAPIVTDDTKSSLNRQLDRALVLSVKQKLGSQYHRVLPQTPWIPGETLKHTCERVVKEICGSHIKVKIFGNAPCGHFKYKYPKEVRKNGHIGAKVFFFPGHVLAYSNEELNSNDIFSEHQWLTHEELKENIGKSYFQAVSKFLISDK